MIKGDTFCIEAPRGKHVPDADADYGWVTYCTYCSTEIEKGADDRWQAVKEINHGA